MTDAPESEGFVPGQDGPDLADMGYLPLPAEVQEALEAAAGKPEFPQALVAATAEAIGAAMITRQSPEEIARSALEAVFLCAWAEYAVAWGGDVEVPGTARIEIYDDAENARDSASLYRGGYVVRRTRAVTRWERVPGGSQESSDG